MVDNNMTTLNHLSDDELIRHCRTQPLDDLSDELHRRLEHLVALVEELDENLHRLAEKYHIEEDDLWYCDGPPITPPPGATPPQTLRKSIGYADDPGRPCQSPG